MATGARTEAAGFDAAIVGGGPAGAATAIALARGGFRVALIERRAAPERRVGETLPPGVRVSLEALGVWEAFAADGHEPAVGNRSYWGSDRPDDLSFVASPYGHGWHIDRARFERMLLTAAEARGVTLLRERQLEGLSSADASAAVRHDGAAGRGPSRPAWTLRVPEALRARCVVDASGRGSVLARACGAARLSIDQLVGATMFLEPREPSRAEAIAKTRANADANASTDVYADARADVDADAAAEPSAADPCGRLTLIEATRDGWWYSAPLPSGRLVAACMTDADLATQHVLRDAATWQARAARTGATAARLAGYAITGEPRISSANTSRLAAVAGLAGGAPWLAVGDAAVAFDPLSSQGLSTALDGARQAADAIARHFAGDSTALTAYAAWVTDVYRTYLVERAQFYGAERRWPDSPFWRRRQAHRDLLADEEARHASSTASS